MNSKSHKREIQQSKIAYWIDIKEIKHVVISIPDEEDARPLGPKKLAKGLRPGI